MRRVIGWLLAVIFIQCSLLVPVRADATALEVQPATTSIEFPNTFKINVSVTAVAYLRSWDFKLFYPNALLNATGILEGPFLKKAGSTTFLIEEFDDNYNSTHGKIWAACTLFGNVSASGDGALAEISFKTVNPGSATLHLAETELIDRTLQYIAHSTIDGTVLITASHDIAVSNLIPFKTNIPEGYNFNVSAAFRNAGNFQESFNASIEIGTATVAWKIVTMAAKTNQTVTFKCSVAGIELYLQRVVCAYAKPVAGEGHTSDNNLADGYVKVVHPGDVTGDGKVDIQDIARVSAGFGSLRVSNPSDPEFNKYRHESRCVTCPHTPNADINGDGKIDIQDLARTSAGFGWHTFLSTISISPATTNIAVFQDFEILISLDYATNLYGYEISLSFDQTKVQVDSLGYDHYLNNPVIIFPQIINNTEGYASFEIINQEPATPKTGGSPPCLLAVQLHTISSGSSTISLVKTGLWDHEGNEIPHLALNGTVNCS